jgi:hypothetical protein
MSNSTKKLEDFTENELKETLNSLQNKILNEEYSMEGSNELLKNILNFLEDLKVAGKDAKPFYELYKSIKNKKCKNNTIYFYSYEVTTLLYFLNSVELKGLSVIDTFVSIMDSFVKINDVINTDTSEWKQMSQYYDYYYKKQTEAEEKQEEMINS